MSAILPPNYVNLRPVKSGDYWKGIPRVTVASFGVPCSLAGATIRMQWRQHPQFAKSALEWNMNPEEGQGRIELTNSLAGEFKIHGMHIPLDSRLYYWDIEVKFSDATTRTIAQGKIIVYQDVTR